jgi:cytochrome b
MRPERTESRDANRARAENLGDSKVRAWDLPTRLFHWTLVALVANAWLTFRYSSEIGDPVLFWHRINGYAILVLIAWRLIWGLVGSSTARFSSFVQWPWRAAGYGLDLLRGRDRHFLGHNPLGSYMVLALLAAVAAQGATGLFAVEHNDIMAGPLYRLVAEDTWKWLTAWHTWFYYWVLLVFIGIHLTANVFYRVVKKDPLIEAMVTGVKPAAAYEDAPRAEISAGTGGRALVCLVIAAALVLGSIRMLGGRLL